MENNFDLLKGFTSLRDFAICMSRSNICCHKANCFVKVASEQAEEYLKKDGTKAEQFLQEIK